MRFLDLDLDFFLNQNAYSSGCDGVRLDSVYKPWSISKTRRFLENKCGLSLNAPVPGQVIESHDGVLKFWRTLIDSSTLPTPFDVIHIDAHPDLCVSDSLRLVSGALHIDPERELEILKTKDIHAGNYLTFAMAYGWIGSLVWIRLLTHLKALPKWDGDARATLMQLKETKGQSSPIHNLPVADRERVVPFKMLSWPKFRANEPFDYMALSRSPNFTPPESDRLIAIVKEYMKQI